MGLNLTPWTEVELVKLKELAGSFSAPYIGEQIGRSAEGVRKQIKKLGLRSFVSTPPKPRPAASRPPSAVPGWARTGQSTPKAVQEPLAAKKPHSFVSYPPLDYCTNCSSPVSNWSDHEMRMRHMGCKRPAA